MAWVHELRGDVSDSTVATYAAYLHRFYAYMTQVGTFESNPMTLVMEELDERVETDPERRDVSLDGMRSFLAGISHPLHRAVIVTFLKTGVRVGELCNLDVRDLRLDGSAAGTEYDLGGRPQLSGRSDSLFVAAAPARGESYNGETRTASNKRKRDTVVPVDAELRRSLERWLAVRPDAVSPAEPLFCSTVDSWGQRLTPTGVRRFVTKYASEEGWYREGATAAENVTPHYFRHFFTTHLRDRTGDRGIVKYLRGDVAGDIIDTYTHNWGDRVRRTYESNIYWLVG
jgi:integrase